MIEEIAAERRSQFAASSVSAYYPLYGFLALLLLTSLSGLLCLNPIRKREAIEPGAAPPDTVALMT